MPWAAFSCAMESIGSCMFVRSVITSASVAIPTVGNTSKARAAEVRATIRGGDAATAM